MILHVLHEKLCPGWKIFSLYYFYLQGMTVNLLKLLMEKVWQMGCMLRLTRECHLLQTVLYGSILTKMNTSSILEAQKDGELERSHTWALKNLISKVRTAFHFEFMPIHAYVFNKYGELIQCKNKKFFPYNIQISKKK